MKKKVLIFFLIKLAWLKKTMAYIVSLFVMTFSLCILLVAKLLHQIELNFAEMIIGSRRFRLVQMKLYGGDKAKSFL
jgi:hypothetical protein